MVLSFLKKKRAKLAKELQIDIVQQQLTEVRETITKMDDRIKDLESRVTDIDGIQTRVHNLEEHTREQSKTKPLTLPVFRW